MANKKTLPNNTDTVLAWWGHNKYRLAYWDGQIWKAIDGDTVGWFEVVPPDGWIDLESARYAAEPRCEDCNGELSACGELNSDGEPSMDCRTCNLACDLRMAKKKIEHLDKMVTLYIMLSMEVRGMLGQYDAGEQLTIQDIESLRHIVARSDRIAKG